jgi:hypothetical protein
MSKQLNDKEKMLARAGYIIDAIDMYSARMKVHKILAKMAVDDYLNLLREKKNK